MFTAVIMDKTGAVPEGLGELEEVVQETVPKVEVARDAIIEEGSKKKKAID